MHRLVRVGLTIGELALHMGWKPSYAARMLDHYLSLDTGQSDAPIGKLALKCGTEPDEHETTGECKA